MIYFTLLLLMFCALARETVIVIRFSKFRKEYIAQNHIDTSCIKIPSLTSEIIKRLFDIIIAGIVCITILPILYIILGVIIKLTSPGDVIFKQKRVGIFGSTFICYKFRSMYQYVNDQMAVKNDVRVTTVGKFIRKTHLDEFPQFYNVLIGDMSLVGPRPTMRFVTDNLDTHPKYIYRTLLRPGISGISQINGRQSLLINMLNFDFEYLQKYSLWQDIKIILQTLRFKDVSY